MEDWQRNHICKNLDTLVDLTECNFRVLTRLKSRDVLSKEDVEILKTAGQTEGKTSQNFKLYEILETRNEGYERLMEALKITKQSGVLKILQKGEKANSNFLLPPSAVKEFLKQKGKSVFIWPVTDKKLSRLWIQQTIHDDDDDFDVECIKTENLAEILKDPPNKKLLCIVEANLQEIEVVLKSFTNLENIDVTSAFPTWTDLTIRYQTELKQRTVLFLEKETKFEDILKKLESFEFPLENLTGNFLIDLINDKQPSLIQSKQYPAQDSYISRTLHSQRMIPIDSIEKFPVEANDIFTFSGFEDINEATRVLKLDYDISTAILGKTEISNRFILLQTKGDYQLICMKTNLNQPIHLLQYVKGTHAFIWVMSRGNLKSIRSLMQSEIQEIREEQLLEAEIQNFEKNIVITGDPGMGKTSVLLNLIKNSAAFKANTTFVKYYVFRDFINLLEKDLEDSKVRPAKLQVINALSYSNENEFEKEIFRLFLKNEEINCLMMLDGYDELQENQQKVATRLLNSLTEIKNIKIIVTSRRHRVAELEKLLNTVAYELQPFSTDDQLKFLINFWRSKGGIKDERLQQYGETCLENWKPAHKTHEKPMGEVPLHCQLLAEVFEAEAVRFSNPNNDMLKECTLPTTLISSVSEIYCKLMAKKREKFQTRYGNEDRIRVDFLHVNTAIQLLTPFSDYWLHHLFTEGKKIDGTEAELEKMLLFGVMKESAPDKVVTFTHQSIAEYIIAEYVVRVLRKEIPIKDWDSFEGYFIFDVLHPISNKVRISRDFTVDDDNAMDGFHFYASGICFFIDELLETGLPKISPIHSPEISKDFWSSLNGSRIVACVLGDLFNIAKLFLSSGSMNKPTPKKEDAINLLILTTMFSSKAFMKEIRNFIEESGMHFPIESIYKILEYPNGISYPLTPLHTAVERGNYELVVYLITTCGFGDLLHELKNLLHASVYLSVAESQPVIQDKKRIITLLVEMNPYMKDELHDYYGVTPILRDYIHIEILQHLASLLVDVNATTSNAAENLGEGKNLTVLHKAYLYRGVVSPFEYNNLLLKFHQAGYNCWSSIAVRSNYSFQILDRIVRYLDASDETLDFLAKQLVDFSQIDAVGNSMVMVAVYFGRSTRFIRKLIQLGGDWKRFAPKGDGILNEAVRKNNTSLITMLVKEFGADIGRPTDNDAGITPIHCSACLSNFKDMMNMIKYLQNLGADINAVDKKHCTLFHAAAAKSRINAESLPMSPNELHEYVMFLKSENFKHFSSKDYRGCTPLHYAVQYSEPFPATVQFLINLGTNINSMDNEGYTIIMYAVEGGRSAKFLEALVQRNADWTTRGIHGTTLLHQAVVHGNSDALEYLSKFICVNMRDDKMRTPLQYLLHPKPFEKLMATLNVLMRLGSDINSTDSKGNTMFNYEFDVAPNDFHSLILSMHKFGFNLKLKNKHKMSILHGVTSQIECLEETLVYLVRHGLQIDCRNEWGHTPLMCVIQSGKSINFVKLLLKNGADPQLKSKSGETCLHLAVRTGNIEVVQMLVTEYKLDANSLANDGCPIHETIFIKSFDLMMKTIKLLVNLGADVNVIVEDLSQ